MGIIEIILKEKNKVLYEQKTEIQNKSDDWIRMADEVHDEIQQNILLANIYYLRTVYSLDVDDATKACEYFEKISFECLSQELIKNYILCLKLSYQFKKAVDILLGLMTIPQSFDFKYYCLRELVDSSMVADGALAREEYFGYKNLLKELLNNELDIIDRTIP